jgi:hypothetical protein
VLGKYQLAEPRHCHFPYIGIVEWTRLRETRATNGKRAQVESRYQELCPYFRKGHPLNP